MRRSARHQIVVRAALVGLLGTVSCSAPAGSPALEAPDPEWFDRQALIDVLPPDAIPAIREPAFEPIERAGWLTDDDPVLVVEVGGDARAYPLAIITRHEIVNDEVGGTAVAVTYCPLCNSGVVYDRTVRPGSVLTFLVSGKLYHSDLVMLDEQTESLWPQLRGQAVLGELKGTELRRLPAALVSFADYRASFPDGRVLVRPGGDIYGTNPYVCYDTRAQPYDNFSSAPMDDRLAAMDRVLGVAEGPVARAYAFPDLAASGNPAVVHDTLGDVDVVVFYAGGARSAIDGPVIAESRRVGSGGAFEPRANGRMLRFAVREGKIIDEQTMSTWSVLGVALTGPLQGTRLPPLRSVDALWFAWRAFVPHTEIWNR